MLTNFELTIIDFLSILRWGEERHHVVYDKQGTIQYSHDLHDWTSKFEIVLKDAIFSEVVDLSKHTLLDGSLSESEMK